jgi:hypothetical protein
VLLPCVEVSIFWFRTHVFRNWTNFFLWFWHLCCPSVRSSCFLLGVLYIVFPGIWILGRLSVLTSALLDRSCSFFNVTMCSGIDKFVRYFCCVARLYVVPVFVRYFVYSNPGYFESWVGCLSKCVVCSFTLLFVLSLLRVPDFVVVWFNGLWRVIVPLPF